MKWNGTDKQIDVDDIYGCKVTVDMIKERGSWKLKQSLLKSIHKKMIGQRRNIQRYKILWKREVFWPVVHTIEGVKQVGYK